MEDGQIVRVTEVISDVALKKGAVGFIVSSSTPGELRKDDLEKEAMKRLTSYGEDTPVANVMFLDEHGFIEGAAIIPISVLEEELGDEHKGAKFKYDKRLLAAEMEQGRAYESMCRAVAGELGVESELVDAVIQTWDRKEREQVSKLRA